MSAQVTQWFTRQPLKEGVWEVQQGFLRFYSHWNGRAWGAVCSSIAEAFELRDSEVFNQDQVWRGLAEAPDIIEPEQ